MIFGKTALPEEIEFMKATTTVPGMSFDDDYDDGNDNLKAIH